MVRHTELIVGREYKLGSMLVGKFKRRKTNGELIFINSQYGEKGENAIDPDDEDDYEPLRNRSGYSKKGGKKSSKKRSKKRNRKTRK
jgi:hypothetical protein